jgi:hypothetical protein
MIFWALVFAVDMVAGDVWENEPKRRRRKDAMFAVLEVVAREGSFAGFCICGLDDGRDGEKRTSALCIGDVDGCGRGLVTMTDHGTW